MMQQDRKLMAHTNPDKEEDYDDYDWYPDHTI